MIINLSLYLESACAVCPDRPALSDADRSITYAQLGQAARALGTFLQTKLAHRRNQPVFVCIDRTLESVVAFWGVLLSGNFYVPIDPSLPDKRLMDIYETVQPELVLTTTPLERPLPFGCAAVYSLAEAVQTEADPAALEAVAARQLDTDPAYCMFTSGSTGVPKGVLVAHRSVIDMAEQFTRAFGFDESCIFGNQAPFDFDVSVKDIYLAAKNRACVHILEKRLFSMPKALIERMNERRVTTVIWAASAMKIISALKTFDKVVPHTLRQVMFSGEALPCKVLNDWRAHLPQAVFVNLYGPTEITCNCTYYTVDRPFADADALPIGKAFANTQVFLLDGEREVTAPGQIGEIAVRGTCLALGYYRAPEQTARAFCQNPLNPDYPERIYRTGDLAKWGEDGNLLFLGRADSQVKHMGHRIELGEIELAANALEGVASACCLYDAAKERLCLFYQGPEPKDAEIAAALRKVLPHYMAPNRFFHYPALPMTRTGKIDRVLLRKTHLE